MSGSPPLDLGQRRIRAAAGERYSYRHFWGIGLAAGDPRAHDPERWPGLNLLGFALMAVRKRLGESTCTTP